MTQAFDNQSRKMETLPLLTWKIGFFFQQKDDKVTPNFPEDIHVTFLKLIIDL